MQPSNESWWKIKRWGAEQWHMDMRGSDLQEPAKTLKRTSSTKKNEQPKRKSKQIPFAFWVKSLVLNSSKFPILFLMSRATFFSFYLFVRQIMLSPCDSLDPDPDPDPQIRGWTAVSDTTLKLGGTQVFFPRFLFFSLGGWSVFVCVLFTKRNKCLDIVLFCVATPHLAQCER